jgi:steroid 5-alpha reductase family enzyme
MITTLLYAFLVAAAVMLAVWTSQIFTKNAGIVDAFWSWNFPLIALIYFFRTDGWDSRQMILLTMVAIWAIRLGTYLFIRTIKHFKTEDVRYARMREEKKPKENSFFLFFFLAQALTNVILSLPFFFPMENPDPSFHRIEYMGMIIWFIGVLGESIADIQLYFFKKDQANKGKVCSVGLWRYSRHPNYFFESVIWIGFAVFACGSPYGWISFFAPAMIIFLLLKVSGIPMTEELAVKSKGEAYREYQRTTNAFIPGKPKS